MKLALAISVAFGAVLLAEPDLQPACRQGCDAEYEAELAACEGQSRQPVDECQDAAQDRHQECIDRCND
jgi:hypothetical protein